MKTIEFQNLDAAKIETGETSSIIIRDSFSARLNKGRFIIVPLSPDHHMPREGSCEDVCLSWQVDLNTGLRAEISIRTDGSIWYAGATPTGHTVYGNTYLHFAREDSPRKKPPTEGQRRTLAELWLGVAELQYFGRAALGRPVCEWAFAGFSPAALSDKYGTGAPVFLA